MNLGWTQFGENWINISMWLQKQGGDVNIGLLVYLYSATLKKKPWSKLRVLLKSENEGA